MEAMGGEGSQELIQVKIQLNNIIESYVESMTLKCALELGIPDVIHKHGKPITLTELANAVSVTPAKTYALSRLMRLLVHSGLFAQETNNGGEDVFLLTNSSKYLLKAKDVSFLPLMFFLTDRMMMDAWHSMVPWLKETEHQSAFEVEHGMGTWKATKDNPKFNNLMNEGMASESSVTAKLIVENCGDVFQGLRSLVDVGGGTGTMARAIAHAFPHIKCTIFDLPQVVGRVPESKTVGLVTGNMFERIQPADAILLKKVLHDWNDEDCVKILRKCKEAIPSKEDGGKVIIIEMLVKTEGGTPQLTRAQLLTDLFVMATTPGKERDEHEWREIFAAAGFKGYEIKHMLGLQSVIVAYH